MSPEQVTLFWSYAHADDEADGGRLLQLSQHLKNEYALLTGVDLVMFVDRDGLAWGDAWRQKIDTAIAHSSFLLAVITPRYFTRKECRNELLTFHGKSGGKDPLELVLPVLYVPVGDLNSSNPDEAIAIVGRTQYENWTELRLAAVESSQYRSAVNGLAKRLAELVANASAAQLERELKAPERDVEADLETLLHDSEEKWAEWLTAVEADEIRREAQQAVLNRYAERHMRLRRDRRGVKEFLNLYQQESRDVLPLEQQHLKWAEIYSAKTIELDALVNAMIKSASENPALLALLREVHANVKFAIEQIRYEVAVDAGYRAIPFEEYLAQMPFVSRSWREIQDIGRRLDTLLLEANDIVEQWHQDLSLLLEGSKEV